jgi:hypothetical protein
MPRRSSRVTRLTSSESPVGISGNQWELVGISGNQWELVAISGNQRVGPAWLRSEHFGTGAMVSDSELSWHPLPSQCADPDALTFPSSTARCPPNVLTLMR